MTLKAVLFDLDGTLLDEDRAVECGLDAFHSAYAPLLGGSRSEFGPAWRSVTEKHMKRFLAGEIAFQEQRRARMRELFGSADLSDAEADARIGRFLSGYEDAWRLYEDVLPALEALKRFRWGIVTNGDPAQQEAKLARLGLRSSFPMMVTAGELRISKPAAGIFHEACRRLGLAPAECAYVGDHLEVDALGSHRAGLRAVWLNRLGHPPAPAEIRTVSTLTELTAVVGSPSA